ncbi:unnamed protein product [Lampetra planeri]
MAAAAATTAAPALGGAALLHRSVERALEDACLSGVLNLSGRKLKDFPRSTASFDLSDVTEADLSRNRLSEVPLDVCHYVSMETLYLYHNCIKSIPDPLGNLQVLTYLNLSRNQLGSLPVHVCKLPMLKVLVLSNNKIGALPPNIGQLCSLLELDVSCNELEVLPPEMGSLVLLRELNVRRNRLTCLPDELSRLPLVSLDFACNRVTEIPLCYRRLRGLQVIQLDNNPLRLPPAQVCVKGKVHIMKFLTVEACRIEGRYEPFETPEQLKRPIPKRFVDSCWRPDSGIVSDSGDKRFEVSVHSSPTRRFCFTRSGAVQWEGASSGEQGSADAHRKLAKMDSIPEGEPQAGGDNGGDRYAATPTLPWSSSMTTPIAATVTIVTVERGGVLVKHGRLSRSVCLTAPFALPRPQRKSIVSARHGGRTGRGVRHRRGKQWSFRSTSLLVLTTSTGEASHINPLERAASHGGDWHPFGLKPRSAFSLQKGRLHPLLPENPNFTVRRKMEQMKEEIKLIEQLRENIESRLNRCLPLDMGSALMDGVMLCNLANHVRPRSVPIIYEPSPAVPQLSMTKCRKNVESFLNACKRIGVPKSALCSPYEVTQGNLSAIHVTVSALLEQAEPRPLGADADAALAAIPLMGRRPVHELVGFCLFYLLAMLMLLYALHGVSLF